MGLRRGSRRSGDAVGTGDAPEVISGPGVVLHAVALTRPIGSSMPWRRQNSDDHAPPESSTDCVRMVPFSMEGSSSAIRGMGSPCESVVARPFECTSM